MYIFLQDKFAVDELETRSCPGRFVSVTSTEPIDDDHSAYDTDSELGMPSRRPDITIMVKDFIQPWHFKRYDDVAGHMSLCSFVCKVLESIPAAANSYQQGVFSAQIMLYPDVASVLCWPLQEDGDEITSVEDLHQPVVIAFLT